MADLTNHAPVLNRQIFDNAPIGMAVSDLEGKLVSVNKSFRKTIGYSKKELLGLSFIEFTHPDDVKENLRRNGLVEQGLMEDHQMEKRFINKKGNVLHAILKVSTLKNKYGKPQFFLAQVLDISDKVDLLSNIKSSERKFREIFEDAAIPMAQANTNGDIFNVNKAFSELFEYSNEELKHMKISDVSHPDDMHENKERSQNLINSEGANYSMEKRYLTKSGKTIHALLKVSYIEGFKEDPPHLLGQIVDISSLKKYENLLEQNNAELKKVNSELDNFIYRASHDLRGPLATMKGLLNLIELRDKETDIVIDGMSSSIEKLENTVRKLVAFSRNAQSKVDKREINLRKTILESIDLFKYHQNFEKVALNIDVDDELSFSTDISRIKPIFNNLISNSLTYIDCTRSDCRIDIICKLDDDKLVIEIADNGEGMTKETLERAFEMFYRGSERSTGSGLGLYLVREVVNKLRGDISIASKYHQGTTVRVSLPA